MVAIKIYNFLTEMIAFMVQSIQIPENLKRKDLRKESYGQNCVGFNTIEGYCMVISKNSFLKRDFFK
jgi:hypothetical protein